MTKDIESHPAEWAELQSKWGVGSSFWEAAQYIIRAFPNTTEAKNRVDMINRSGYGNIGSLDLDVEQKELIDVLQDGRQTMDRVCGNIHDELLELIDIPFTEKMGKSASIIFSIDPQTITCSQPGIIGEKEVSLYDMIKPTLNFRELESDFIRKFDEVQEPPSQKLKDTLSNIVDTITQKYVGADVNDIPDLEKRLLVSYYEFLNPDNAEKMNVFLDPIIQDGTHDIDIMNIKFIAYKSEEPYNTIMFHYLPEISIVDFNWPDSQHYHPESLQPTDDGHPVKSIAANLDPDRALNDPAGSYFTFFHELGHAMDDRMRIDGVFVRRTSGLQDILRDDLYDVIKTEIINTSKTPLSEKQISDIVNSFTVGGTILPVGSYEEEIRNQVIAALKDSLLGDNRSTVSDVVGGFTNNIITGSYSHALVKKDGKPSYYWTDEYGQETGAQSSEWFAGYFSANVTGYPIQKEVINDFFKHSTSFIDKQLENVFSSLTGETK